MNQKTVKLLRKYAKLKGMDEMVAKKSLKREWLAMDKSAKDAKRQEMVQALQKS
ncbi:MAG: hypothetical protein AAF518_25330 [Spirochaetota bacterium]